MTILIFLGNPKAGFFVQCLEGSDPADTKRKLALMQGKSSLYLSSCMLVVHGSCYTMTGPYMFELDISPHGA